MHKDWKVCIVLQDGSGGVTFTPTSFKIKQGKEIIEGQTDLHKVIDQLTLDQSANDGDLTVRIEDGPSILQGRFILMAYLYPVSSDEKYAVSYVEFIRLLNGLPLTV
jgi:hypothetical protein